MQSLVVKHLSQNVKQLYKNCAFFSSKIQTSQAKLSSENQKTETVYGQPTHQTHPDLIKPGELIPGFKLEEFKERREKLVEKIISEESINKISSKHVIIIPSANKVYMSEKIPYVFRQNTDFLYFSGCLEPDSTLVITINGDSHESTIFVRSKDEKSELWDGPRTGAEAAAEFFGVDQSLSVQDFGPFIQSYISDGQGSCNLWYENKEVIQMDVHRRLAQIVKATGLKQCYSPKTVFHQLRVIKSPSEIEMMKETCRIGSEAITKTMQVTKPGMSEHHIFATVDYECRMRGAEYLAYLPVVAGGNNANVIHYINNNQVVKDGNMVLMDAGSEYHGYTSDITRTWPINGKFTDPQRVVYEIVLEVQKILIKQLEQFPTLDMLFHEMCRLLGKKLQEAGLVPKSMNDNQLTAAAYLYCPHHVSHYLGMDVHDTGKIPRTIRVQPGMVVTVEPGIYINTKNQLAPPEFRGLGIRIEDDVLVTEQGPVVLTAPCPKEISDIENLISSNQVK